MTQNHTFLIILVKSLPKMFREVGNASSRSIMATDLCSKWYLMIRKWANMQTEAVMHEWNKSMHQEYESTEGEIISRSSAFEEGALTFSSKAVPGLYTLWTRLLQRFSLKRICDATAIAQLTANAGVAQETDPLCFCQWAVAAVQPEPESAAFTLFCRRSVHM